MSVDCDCDFSIKDCTFCISTTGEDGSFAAADDELSLGTGILVFSINI